MKDIIFSPSFGNKPTNFVGRDEVIYSFLEGLRSPSGDKTRATLILGQRGIGKTVLLLNLADEARKQGYIVASPTITSKDMLNRIVEKIQDEGESKVKTDKSKLSGGNLGFLGFSIGLQFTREEQETKSFAYRLKKICNALEEKGYGVLILVDEVVANSEDLKELIITYQELVGEGANIAIALAGLPEAISSVLNNHVLTFLNRASKIELSTLRLEEVNKYYKDSFKKLGININSNKLDEITKISQGFPYLMQLIGHHITVLSDEDGSISEEMIDKAVSLAKEEFINDICKTTLNALSDKDIVFLKAMAKEEKAPYKMKDIIDSLGVTKDYAQIYKRRLLDSGIIYQPKRGEVDFAIPYLKEYLENDE